MRACVLTVAVFLTSLGCLHLTEGARSKRDVFQLGALVRKVGAKVEYPSEIDPFKLLGYGCYCGLGGYGTPLDDIDRCCQAHDSCYDEGRVHCADFRFLRYFFTCNGEECKLRGSNDRCQNEAFQCDLTFAKCIKASWGVYNKGYLHARNNLCKEGE